MKRTTHEPTPDFWSYARNYLHDFLPKVRALAPRSIEAFHAAALSNGGRDNGAPGLRADYSPDYYAAFVIDPDGYRLEAHCSRSAA